MGMAPPPAQETPSKKTSPHAKPPSVQQRPLSPPPPPERVAREQVVDTRARSQHDSRPQCATSSCRRRRDSLERSREPEQIVATPEGPVININLPIRLPPPGASAQPRVFSFRLVPNPDTGGYILDGGEGIAAVDDSAPSTQRDRETTPEYDVAAWNADREAETARATASATMPEKLAVRAHEDEQPSLGMGWGANAPPTPALTPERREAVSAPSDAARRQSSSRPAETGWGATDAFSPPGNYQDRAASTNNGAGRRTDEEAVRGWGHASSEPPEEGDSPLQPPKRTPTNKTNPWSDFAPPAAAKERTYTLPALDFDRPSPPRQPSEPVKPSASPTTMTSPLAVFAAALGTGTSRWASPSPPRPRPEPYSRNSRSPTAELEPTPRPAQVDVQPEPEPAWGETERSETPRPRRPSQAPPTTTSGWDVPAPTVASGVEYGWGDESPGSPASSVVNGKSPAMDTTSPESTRTTTTSATSFGSRNDDHSFTVRAGNHVSAC